APHTRRDLVLMHIAAGTPAPCRRNRPVGGPPRHPDPPAHTAGVNRRGTNNAHTNNLALTTGPTSPESAFFRTLLAVGERQLAYELRTGSHAELPVRVVEVKLDGLGTQEQRGRCLVVGRPFGDGHRDLQFLRRQMPHHAILAWRQDLTCCA